MANNKYPVINYEKCTECYGDATSFSKLEEGESEKNCSCNCQNGCCDGTTTDSQKSIVIDFLYLDLSVCERCQDTDSTLDEAIEAVKTVLEVTGMDVKLNKINVISEALAEQHKFESSPTIRINGQDLQLEVKENSCESCGDLCGEDVDCRVWSYQGKDYNVPPKAMIVEAILKTVYGAQEPVSTLKTYTIPTNLKQFYSAMIQK